MVWVPAPTTSLIASKVVECMLEGGLPEGASCLKDRTDPPEF